MAKAPKDDNAGRKVQSDASRKIVSMSQKMETIRKLLLRLDREKVSILDQRLSTLEKSTSSDGEFSERLAKQLLVALKKMDANGKRTLAKYLAEILNDDVKIQIRNAEPQIRQALLPSFGAFIRQGIVSEFRKLGSVYLPWLFNDAPMDRSKAIENGKTNSPITAEKVASNVHRMKHVGGKEQNFLFLGSVIVLIALLIWGGGTAINHVWQTSLINRVQTAIEEQPELAAYPFSFEMYPGNGIMRVTGLLSDSSQFSLLDKILRRELPNMRFDKNVRIIFDDAVVPKLDRLAFSVETNSQNIDSLDEKLSIQQQYTGEVEQAFIRTDRMIGVLRAMKPDAPNFYMSKALAVLRTDVEATMSTPESTRVNSTETLDADSIEQLVGGLTIAFSEHAEIIDSPRAFQVGQVLEAALRGNNAKRQVNVVAVVKTSNGEAPSAASKRGQIMLRQAMRILLANGIKRDNLNVSVMFEDPMSLRSNLLEGVSQDSWLHNNFIGLSFAH